MIQSIKVTIQGIKGVGLPEVLEKKHNLWVGVSLSNKFFSSENIKSLILFSLKHTKEKILILIPGRMHAINYQYFQKMSHEDALKKGFEAEELCREEVKSILSELTQDERNKVLIANYDEVCTPKYLRQRDLFYREFSKKGEFYKRVSEIVEEIIVLRGRTVTQENIEGLASYVLQELPLMCDGLQKIGDDTIFTVVSYPGSGKIDELEIDIIEGEKFPELTSALGITNRIGLLDVSV